MKMVFIGIQKEGVSSIDFFTTLEELGLSYDVDLRTGEIIISDVKSGMRNDLVREISKVFEIERMTTTKDENKIITELDQALAELKEAVYSLKNHEKTKVSCIRALTQDIKLYDVHPKYRIYEGEIIGCNMGYGIQTENHGNMNVVVLQKTEEDKYLVVPIDMTSEFQDAGFCIKVEKDTDAVYYNDNYTRESATIYLNRVQEISIKRFRTIPIRVGRVTKKLLKKVYERLYQMGPVADLTVDEMVDDMVKIALLKKPDENTQAIELFLRRMKISEDSTLLRAAFYLAFEEGTSTLKEIIPMLKDQYGIVSVNEARQELRSQFLGWLAAVNPDILENYPKISLANILKPFLRHMN